VLAYVKKGLGIVRLPELEEVDNEIIVSKLKKQMIVGLYSGFKTEKDESVVGNFKRLVANLGQICQKSSSILIGGDFNADPAKKCQKSDALIEWQCEHGLDQLVQTQTRVRLVESNIQSSMLDLVFSKEIDSVDIEVVPSEVSDHHLVKASFMASVMKQRVKFEKKIVVDWRKYSDTKMNNALRSHLSELNGSPDIMDRDLTTSILAVMNQVIPKRVVHLRRQTDMVNYSVEAMKKKRDRLIKQAKKENCAVTMSKVKDLDKKIKRLIVKERKRMIENKMKDSSPATFWKTMNDLLGRSGGKDVLEIMDSNNARFLSESEAADAFAMFFRDKVEGLINQNPISDEDLVLTNDRTDHFSIEEIRCAMKTFKPKKSAGPDEVPLLVLKSCYDTLEPYLDSLFKKIVQCGKIPKTWKVARIKPVHKKGPKSDVTMYRPISNLNSVSKLFERCILNRISGSNDGLNQHGFKAGHSTVSAALELQDEIAKNLDKNRSCLIYSMDLSAAFDLIRPGIFAKKASQVIEDKGIVNLLLDFITERKAYVEVGEATSIQVSLPVGCPQGSTLGPKIFNIYCHDLIEELKEGFIVTYVNDSYVLVTSEDSSTLRTKTEETMASHLGWLQKNGMVCNTNKTEILTMNTDSECIINVGSTPVKATSSMKVLGLMFDNKLEWTSQVNQTIMKTNRLFHGLKHVRRFLTMKQMKQAVTSYYFSVLYYGLEVWFHRNLPFKLKQRLRSAHYRALRLIYGREKSREELDVLSARATPDEMSDYSIAKFAARMFLQGSPKRLLESTQRTSYTTKRMTGRLLFYDDSTKKIGRQCLRNRLQCVSKHMKFDWLNCEVSSLRVNLKKSFFKYYQVQNRV
jgi:hypothetical protein